MFLQRVYHRFSLFPSLTPRIPLSSSTAHKFGCTRVYSKPFKSHKISCSSSFSAMAAEDRGGGPNGSVSSPGSLEVDFEDNLGGYRLPPPEIRDIVDAPPLPALSFSPLRDKILFLKRRALPPLAELAKPEEKLAGIRINGGCNTRSRMSFYTGISIHNLTDDGTLGPEKEIYGFPDGAKINFVCWSRDGRHLSFTIRFDEGRSMSLQENSSDSGKLKVWVADVETGEARPLFQSPDMYVNAVFDK
ncbi:hypothetical protein QJS10_CPB04g00971 [Acorus calamus]|uniref:Uncharacterized protein n=1 Tax=Acorus calamus TaxID=4465 RepID=A0AAV9F5K7_ACOCL|nr:hypothetical protein QJS10_CPB04g00971 [Acorus calamus]